MEEIHDYSITEFFLKKKEVLENKSVLIDKPVNEIIDKVDSSKKSKIILSGPEDSGKKLTTLKYMDEKEDLFVYFNLNDFEYYNMIKDKSKTESYIEAIIAGELLKVLSSLGLNSQMLFLGANMPYMEQNLDLIRNYHAGDLISTLIYRIKKLTDKKLVLVVDKIDMFDENVQKIIFKYFDIFDQNIVISNDEAVYGSNYRRENLKEKGFDIINIDYAKEPKVLIDIIDARIKLHNQRCSSEYKLKLLEQMLDEEVIKKIAILSNGNIRKILCTAKLAYSKCNRESENKSAVGKYILNTLDRSKNITEFTPVKTLYL